MEFRLLGAFEVWHDGQPVEIVGSKRRALLALLALRANEVVRSELLVDELWGERPPRNAAAALHSHVSRLRKTLGADTIARRESGYVLRASTTEVDVGRLERLLGEAEALPTQPRATKLAEALALWRGPTLADLINEPALHRDIARLEELRLNTLERRIDADLELGRDVGLIGELETLIFAQPLREHFRWQLILALYRAGRQAEALETYRQTRRMLTEELGLEPSPALKELEQAILRQDPSLEGKTPPTYAEQPSMATPAPTPSRPQRKTVTVVCCEAIGLTELGDPADPEALSLLLASYFERVKGIVAMHGGSVERFIGDAVMAVFGVPATHEDDAFRACRAAMDMRDALQEVGLQGRIGVNTGEVLTGNGEQLATGDPVNVAAHFEQAAEPGEVLIGTPTLLLVAGSVEVGEERLLALKGKSARVAAYPLASVSGVSERAHAGRFVGRERELQMLQDAWDRAVAGSRCELVTVVGEAGVGKSRLVAEFLAGLDARIVSGRCLSYGEGITYWPVVEVLRKLDASPRDELAARAIGSLLGENDEAVSTDEIAWAFRKLLEEQAPLIVLFDDIQWGEKIFLDLVELMALLSTGAPLLLIGTARPELLDGRSGWPATLRLKPLPPHEAIELIGDAVSEGVRERIVRAAGGNPLFLTEMLALAGNEAEVEVPATLRALLAARLDQLDEAERQVVERGAVEGEVFHRGALQALAPEETEIMPRLAALVRHELIRPERPLLPREDAYRFLHLLIRDAAYDALPKVTRAELHARFAAWLDEHGQGVVELDEIIGYHLEQAARYLDELGRPDPALALAAGDRLALAGSRAHWSRGDPRAAAVLLERGLTLTRPHRLDVRLEAELVETLTASDAAHALAVAEAMAAHADAVGDEAGLALARALVANERLLAGSGSADEVEQLARQALTLLEASGNDDGLVWVWQVLVEVARHRLRMADWALASERSMLHARRAGHPASADVGQLPLVLGPLPASEALEKLDSLISDHPRPHARVLRAVLLAMLDQIEEAWAVALPAREQAREMGIQAGDAWLAEIALIAGDHETAAGYLRETCYWFEKRGVTPLLAGFSSELARVLCALGRPDEAEPLAQRGQELALADDVFAQANWRQALALVHSAHAQHAEAEQLARDAVDWAARSDCLPYQRDTFCTLGEVLETAGRREQAITAWHQALALLEQKQIIPQARRVREHLNALRSIPPSRCAADPGE